MWIAHELTDKSQILAFLETDRLYAAYAIGDLEPKMFAQSTWAGAEQDGRTEALALYYTGLEPPALFLMGNADGLRAILEDVLRVGVELAALFAVGGLARDRIVVRLV